MRSIHFLRCLALIAFAGQAQTPPQTSLKAGEAQRAIQIFDAHVQQYVKLRTGVEASLPALKPTKQVAKITGHQDAFADKIVQARSAARQGDIFSPDVAAQFRAIIRAEFRGATASLARKTIRPDDPSKVVARLHVNDVYPDTMPVTTTPPTLLGKLPQLPKELTYRIVGRDLTLIDTKAGLIVDLIPNAIP